jgi:hypothetical protein
MSRIFKRPMFRKGGPTNNMNGIMSGIVDRENHAEDPFVGGQTARERLLALYDQAPDKSIDPLSQFLITGGLNLMSARPTGPNILATAAKAFKEPTGKLFENIGAKERARRKIAMEGEILDIERDIEKEKSIFDANVKKDVAKIQQRGALDIKKDYLDQVYDIKRSEAAGNETLLKQIEDEYQRDLNLYLVKGLDVSDIYNVVKGDEIQATILQQAEDYLENNLETLGLTGKDDPNYGPTLLSVMAEFTKSYGEKLATSFATGGRVGYAMGTPKNMNQDVAKPPVTVGEKTVTSGPQMDITYEELRTRLPEEISNEVVKLLSTSYEALADFAELRTQADVDAFNSRYGVNLILPQEA